MKKVLTTSILALSLLSLNLSLSGCAALQKKVVIHPGSLSTFDSYTFDVLYSAQKTLEDTKVQFKDTQDSKVKGLLNESIAAYNIAESAYQTFHKASTPQNLQNLQLELDNLVKAISYMKTTLGVK